MAEPCEPVIVAFHVRSGVVALNVVTAALDADPRTQDVEVRFVKTAPEAAPTGASSNWLKSASRGTPNEASTVRLMAANGAGGRSSWSSP